MVMGDQHCPVGPYGLGNGFTLLPLLCMYVNVNIAHVCVWRAVEMVTWWHITARSHTSANLSAATRVIVTHGRCVDTLKTITSSCWLTQVRWRTVTVGPWRQPVHHQMPLVVFSVLICHSCSILAVPDLAVDHQVWHLPAAPTESGLLVSTHLSKFSSG